MVAGVERENPDLIVECPGCGIELIVSQRYFEHAMNGGAEGLFCAACFLRGPDFVHAKLMALRRREGDT